MRLPTFTDLYYTSPTNLGNYNLRPEKALTFEGGTRFKNKFIDAAISIFYRNGKETIDWIWQDSIWHSMNITDLDVYGVETTLKLSPEWIKTYGNFIKNAGISYSYNGISKSSGSHISAYALDNLRQKFVFDLGVQLPANFYLDIRSIWQERNGSYLYYSRPDAEPYETPYGNYLLIDITAGIKLKRLSLFIDASNILNTNYRDIGSVVMPGRWIMFGVRIR